jgi:hypothetical protein
LCVYTGILPSEQPFVNDLSNSLLIIFCASPNDPQSDIKAPAP